MTEKKKTDWKKVWKFILGMKVELAFFCYFAPGTLNSIGLELLPVEKACRINLNYPNDVCSNLNNGDLKAFCSDVYDFQGTLSEDDLNQTEKIDSFLTNLTSTTNNTDLNFDILFDVCTAERDAQAIILDVQNARAPFQYLALIVIIFVGPYGDKYNKKKLFLLLPTIGELISVSAYLTTSIFKTAVPVQFHLYLETIANSLCGGFSLMLMGVFSILASTTSEDDRTFRFGVFSAFSSGSGIILAPFAKYIFEYLGYVNMFLMCILIHVFGIIYIIFFIEEVPRASTETKSIENKPEKPTTTTSNGEKGLDNPGYDKTSEGSSASTLEVQFKDKSEKMIAEMANKSLGEAINKLPEETRQNFFRESIDMFFSNFKVFSVIRPFSGRIILCLVMVGFTVFAFSNTDVIFLSNFGRVAWGWTTEFALYSSFNQAMSFLGTLILTGVFVNVFKWADSILVIVAVLLRLVSRILYTSFKDTTMIYVAGGVDMFNSAPVVAIRSILSKTVAIDELGRIYTVMSVVETVVSPLSVKTYLNIFLATLQTTPAAFYFLSIGLLTVVIILFIRIHSLVKVLVKGMEEKESDQNDNIEESRL